MSSKCHLHAFRFGAAAVGDFVLSPRYLNTPFLSLSSPLSDFHKRRSTIQMIKNGRRSLPQATHTFRTATKVDASLRAARSLFRIAVIGGGGREVVFADLLFRFRIGEIFFLSLTRPPRFKSERELNIVVCKQRWRGGLFFASKMHDKQGQRFSVKARKFFSH